MRASTLLSLILAAALASAAAVPRDVEDVGDDDDVLDRREPDLSIDHANGGGSPAVFVGGFRQSLDGFRREDQEARSYVGSDIKRAVAMYNRIGLAGAPTKRAVAMYQRIGLAGAPAKRNPDDADGLDDDLD